MNECDYNSFRLQNIPRRLRAFDWDRSYGHIPSETRDLSINKYNFVTGAFALLSKCDSLNLATESRSGHSEIELHTHTEKARIESRQPRNVTAENRKVFPSDTLMVLMKHAARSSVDGVGVVLAML